MALTSTIFNFDIDLSHIDRGVYETLALRVAQHPSESAEYLVTRVLAYCLEYTEGIAFSQGGISDPDEPALAVRDLTGAIRVWIDIGLPDPARLHKAAKLAPRVVVYTHRNTDQWLAQLGKARIHRGELLELYTVSREVIDACVARLDRRMACAVTVVDGRVMVALGDHVFEGGVTRHTPGSPSR